MVKARLEEFVDCGEIHRVPDVALDRVKPDLDRRTFEREVLDFLFECGEDLGRAHALARERDVVHRSRWNRMTGDERVGSGAGCEINFYDGFLAVDVAEIEPLE